MTKLVAVVAGAFALAAGGAAQYLPSPAHVVLIVLENKDASEINARSAPALTSLGLRYARLTNYFAVTHPSLPNYVALVSGSTHGIRNDCTACSVDGQSIGDQLVGGGRSWAAYAEGFPSGARFAKEHLPFLYFADGRPMFCRSRASIRTAFLTSLSSFRTFVTTCTTARSVPGMHG